MAWSTSTRRSRLPRDWPRRVAETKRRAAGRCEAERHEPQCDGTGSQCDHHERGDDHSLTNLRWLNAACHKAKTQREAAAGRGFTVRQRKVERIPGLITPNK